MKKVRPSTHTNTAPDPGLSDLRALGRTPDRPWGVWEHPLGERDPSDPFGQRQWQPFEDAFRSGDRRRQLAWMLEYFVYTDLASMDLTAKLGLVRVLEELVSGVTRRHWSVARTAPEVRGTVTKRDSLSKRKRLSEPMRQLLDMSRHARVFLTRPADPTEGLLAAQTAAREVIETVMTGGFFYLGSSTDTERHDSPATETMRASRTRLFWGPVSISILVTPPGGGIWEGVRESIHATLPDALVAAVLALLHAIPATALGRCEYTNGTPCGRIFVKRGPQKWCAEHRRVVRVDQLRSASEAFQKKRARTKKNGRRRR